MMTKTLKIINLCIKILMFLHCKLDNEMLEDVRRNQIIIGNSNNFCSPTGQLSDFQER